jgi:hypothetical protein
MTFPSADVDTGHVDSPTVVGDPALARGDILDLMQKFNLLRNHFSTFMAGAINTWTNAETTKAALGTDTLPVTGTSTLALGKMSVLTTTSPITLDLGLTVGGLYCVYNNQNAGPVVVNQGTGVTLVMLGTTATGNRLIAPYGKMFIHVHSASVYGVSGPGVV